MKHIQNTVAVGGRGSLARGHEAIISGLMVCGPCLVVLVERFTADKVQSGGELCYSCEARLPDYAFKLSKPGEGSARRVENAQLRNALVKIETVARNCVGSSAPLVATQTFGPPLKEILKAAQQGLCAGPMCVACGDVRKA